MKINVATNNIPVSKWSSLTTGKLYEATHIARDMYTIIDDQRNKMTITIGRGCPQLNNRKWKVF